MNLLKARIYLIFYQDPENILNIKCYLKLGFVESLKVSVLFKPKLEQLAGKHALHKEESALGNEQFLQDYMLFYIL